MGTAGDEYEYRGAPVITMKQIATETGVSVSTVSLVLNNRDRGRVKSETAKAIRRTAKRLGYHPNPMARSLRTSRTGMLGFISEEVATTPYAGAIIKGAQDSASTHGYVLLTVSTDGSDREPEQIQALKRYGVDGFLYAKMYDQVVDLPSPLRSSPSVVVNALESRDRCPSIAPDEYLIGYDATRHLIESGCRKIAYIGTTQDLPAQVDRQRGYEAALHESGLSKDPGLVCKVGFNQEALDTVGALVDRASPDGFFCFNDSRSFYVYQIAAARHLSIGRDISLVGVDNHPVMAETTAPRLTTVELPHYEMGYWAARKLMDLIGDSDFSTLPWPQTRAPLPPLDAEEPTRIHCRLVVKDSARADARSR